MVHTDGHPGPPSWTLLTSLLDPPGIPPLLTQLADRHGLHTDRTCLRPGSTRALHLELASSVLGPRILLDRGPVTTSGPWRHGLRPDDDRHRHLVLHAGRTRFTLHLDLTAHGGWQLDRNHHRLTAERDGELLHESILIDSPLRTSVRHAGAALQAEGMPPVPDLAPPNHTRSGRRSPVRWPSTNDLSLLAQVMTSQPAGPATTVPRRPSPVLPSFRARGRARTSVYAG